MLGTGLTSDDVVQHNELRPRRRRPRATTYQLEIYKTSVEEGLENENSIASKSPPRPLLRRNPHSSPVLSRSRIYSAASANAGPAADSSLTTSPTSPTKYRLPPLYFEKHDYSDIFDERPRIEYDRTTPRLRRKAKMSITRDSSNDVSPQQKSLPTELPISIAVITQDVDLLSTSSASTLGKGASGTCSPAGHQTYVINDKSYDVGFVHHSIDDVLSGQAPIDSFELSQATTRIEGIIYLYDATKADVLLSLPGLFDVLKQAKLPTLIAPVCDTAQSHDVDVTVGAVEVQCGLVMNEMELYNASPKFTQAGCVPFLIHRIHSSLHGFPDIASEDDALNIPVKHPSESLPKIRTRNDSKYSVFMQADAEKPRQKPLLRDISKNNTSKTQHHDGDCREDQRTYSTLTSLIQRLLATPSSDADVQFTSIFLTLYKMFAAPIDLLDALLDLTQSDSSHNRITDTNSSARLIAIVHYWIVSYPGDFAQGPTRDRLKIFLSSFTKDDPFQARRQQIDQALSAVTQDDNTLWACKDDAASLTPTTSRTSEVCLNQSPASITQVESRVSETSKRASVTKSRSRINIPSLQRPSLSPTSNKSFVQQPMGKADWRAFMELPEEILAQSIAIINRRLFVAAKPRDFIRQITVPAKSRAAFPSLSHIAALTAHFNHLAHWVATIVLIRDKAKHRVLALEKVMRLARRVRSLNDYNALGAIVAGIHNSAIHRLQSTRELLDKDVAKDFARLEILMGSGKGHAAYRLAWENTTMKGRVPYLPVLLSDLVAADASGPILAPQSDADAPMSPASPTSPAGLSGASRKDRLINWQKFARMGEVLLLLETAQASVQKHMAAEAELNETARLLLEKTVSDDDELYARSCAVEAPASGYTSTNNSVASEGGIGKRFANAFANMSSNDGGEVGSISQMRLPRQ